MAASSNTTVQIKEGSVLLNGELVFTVSPMNKTKSTVETAGFWETSYGRLWVGTGTCCHGHLYEVAMWGDKSFSLENIISSELNVMDILPVYVHYDKAGFPNPDGVLIAGFGCAGAGVRLVGVTYPKIIEVLGTDEFLQGGGNVVLQPRFFLDRSTKKIGLGYRDAAAPRMDITDRLVAAGVELEATFELVEDYRTIYR